MAKKDEIIYLKRPIPDWAGELRGLNMGGPAQTLRFYAIALAAAVVDAGGEFKVSQKALQEIFGRVTIKGAHPELTVDRMPDGSIVFTIK